METVLASGSSVLGGFVNFILILFVLFYLLIDWDHFFTLLKQLIPIRFQVTAQILVSETDGLLSQYLRGQMLVILIMAVFYSAGLSLTGMQGALGLGVFTAIVIIIPYIGIAIGLVLAVLSVILQFGFSSELIVVLVIFGIGQVLEGFFLTPRLVGERIGLHPVAVLFALLIFAKLFGFFGVLLALPASAIVLVLIRFAWSLYEQSTWYRK
jgi:predicted PurR-regulated permease PerM